MGIAGAVARRNQSQALGFLLIPARRRAFCTDGGPRCPTVRLAGSRSRARGGNADDPKAQGRPVSAVLAKEESENRQTAQPWHIQDAPGGRKARARDQSPLSCGTRRVSGTLVFCPRDACKHTAMVAKNRSGGLCLPLYP